MTRSLKKFRSPSRFRPENLTRAELAVIAVLTAAAIWGLGARVHRMIAVRTSRGKGIDLYSRLQQALPDPEFYSLLNLQNKGRLLSPDPGDDAVYDYGRTRISDPLFGGESEMEISETGWIFFPRDYYTTLNINTATLAELKKLPGIGPKTARRIIQYREKYSGFIKPTALRKVRGIGPRIYRRLEDRIRVH